MSDKVAFRLILSKEQPAVAGEFVQALIESSLDGILAFDTSMNFTVWNVKMEAISGIPASRVLGRNLLEVFPHVRLKPKLVSIYKKVLAGESVRIVNQEFTYLTTGEKGYYEGNWSPVFDENLNIQGGLAVVRDITQKRLVETEQQLFFESSLDLIAVVDSNGKIKKVNPSLEKALGYTIDELVGKPFQKQIHPDDLPKVYHEIARISRGEPQQAFECRSICKDASIRWISWKIVIKDGRAYNSGRDITEEKLMQERLLKQNEILIYSSKMSSLGQMAAGLAFEVSDPLSSINLNVDLAKDHLRELGPKARTIGKLLNSIERAALRVTTTIKALMYVSRETSVRLPENVSLKQVLENTLLLCRKRFKSRGVKFTTSPISPGLAISGRDAELSQVFLNLLTNAYEAVENINEKWIDLEVKETTETIQISITDSGKGIKPEIQQRIMEPFFTTKPSGNGSGLGLSISKGIVESHSGVLFLDTSHKHTRFVVRLPRTSR